MNFAFSLAPVAVSVTSPAGIVTVVILSFLFDISVVLLDTHLSNLGVYPVIVAVAAPIDTVFPYLYDFSISVVETSPPFDTDEILSSPTANFSL